MVFWGNAFYMGILNIVENVKKIHKEYIVLVKIGTFYYCYGRDSYIISYLFNYKINILKNNIYSCAFSQNAIHKVTAKLENSKINYLILDRRNNYQLDEKFNNKNLNKYTEIYEKAKSEISGKMRIEKIYCYLLENKDDKVLINQIEKEIHERRKVSSN